MTYARAEGEMTGFVSQGIVRDGKIKSRRSKKSDLKKKTEAGEKKRCVLKKTYIYIYIISKEKRKTG